MDATPAGAGRSSRYAGHSGRAGRLVRAAWGRLAPGRGSVQSPRVTEPPRDQRTRADHTRGVGAQFSPSAPSYAGHTPLRPAYGRFINQAAASSGASARRRASLSERSASCRLRIAAAMRICARVRSARSVAWLASRSTSLRRRLVLGGGDRGRCGIGVERVSYGVGLLLLDNSDRLRQCRAATDVAALVVAVVIAWRAQYRTRARNSSLQSEEALDFQYGDQGLLASLRPL